MRRTEQMYIQEDRSRMKPLQEGRSPVRSAVSADPHLRRCDELEARSSDFLLDMLAS